MVEIWKPIPGFENKYEISNIGRVRSFAQSRRKGHILSADTTRTGYLQVNLGKGFRSTVHRLVLLAFVGPCPTGLEVRHLDGDKSNNNLVNLRYGTKKQNSADADRHGRKSTGSRHGMAKLNEAQVKAIKCLLGTEHQTQTAKRFGVSSSTISLIEKGRIWKHV